MCAAAPFEHRSRLLSVTPSDPPKESSVAPAAPSQDFPELPTFCAAHAPERPAPPDDPSQYFPELPTFRSAPAAATRDKEASPVADDLAPLPARQLSALEMLLTGATDTAVARALGVSRRTVYNWRNHNPRFREHLRVRRAELFDQTSARLCASLSAAVDSLDAHLASPHPLVRHRAACALLSLSRLWKYL